MAINCASAFIRDACYCQGHWNLAKEYYSTAQAMPHVLVKTEVPADKIKSIERANKVMTFLNLTIPLLEGISYFIADIIFDTSKTIFRISAIFVTSTKFGVVALEIVSACYFGVAVFRIRNHIQKNGTEDEVNISSLLMHFGAFGLYLVSAIVLLVFNALYYIFSAASWESLMIAFDITNCLSCLS